MFEFLFAKKYLIPRRKQLSVSLIAMMSVIVISLVVWLVLVFLSVTEGIERGWLKRLTSLNAPLRITPTQDYFHSYYYLADSIAYESGYSLKTIGEKALALKSDPIDPEIDSTPPLHWPNPLRDQKGEVRDLVKELFASLKSIPSTDLVAQDYQMTGALLRLRMLRPELGKNAEEKQNFLTQVSYIASFSDQNPYLHELLLPPTLPEIDHLFHMTEIDSHNVVSDRAELAAHASSRLFQTELKRLLNFVTIKKIQPAFDYWPIPSHLLGEESWHAIAKKSPRGFSYLLLTDKKPKSSDEIAGQITLREEGWLFEGKETFILPKKIPILLENPVAFEADLDLTNLTAAHRLSDLSFHVRATLQNHILSGSIAWNDLEIVEADIHSLSDRESALPPWAVKNSISSTISLPDSTSILLPKNYQENGVQIGDCGYLSFGAMTSSSVQEQRLQVKVAGFYDPGVMALGAKYILCHPDLVRDIASANQSFTFDRELSTGVQVWFSDLDQTAEICAQLQKKLDEKGLSSFWRITPFYQYDFAKDLLQQFQSDRYLFTLIGLIILIVACTNIISLLVLLVNDKREEIAILQAMGASTRSIGTIFALSGIFMGLIGSLIGSWLALVTMHNIDTVVNLLSFLQGHQAFNSAFYGKSLPSELSASAVTFILITTPIISLLAGIIPALKACRMRPSDILRS